jgi:hypothetical protein
MGQSKEMAQDLSAIATTNVEIGNVTRWNYLKIIALVTVCSNNQVHTVVMILRNAIGSPILVFF